MFITQRDIPVRELFREFIGQIFEKSGEIRVRDSCSRKKLNTGFSTEVQSLGLKMVSFQ